LVREDHARGRSDVRELCRPVNVRPGRSFFAVGPDNNLWRKGLVCTLRTELSWLRSAAQNYPIVAGETYS
jgi:hypothetical protein